MESSEANKDTPDKLRTKRRSIKAKNLEEEVELILSQDESDDHSEEQPPGTPSASGSSQHQSRVKDVETPRTSDMTILKEFLQTPRRSCRKSIKPAQDYDDIIKRSMRSVGKSAKKSLMTFPEEENDENMESLQVEEDPQPKWTTAAVGKSSTKRSRKSKRNTTTTATKGKKNQHDDTKNDDRCEKEANECESQRKLDMDCVGSKGVNEQNSSENVQDHIEVIENVQQEGATENFCVENAKDTVHMQSLQAVEECDKTADIASVSINDIENGNKQNKEIPHGALADYVAAKEEQKEEISVSLEMDTNITETQDQDKVKVETEDLTKVELSEVGDVIEVLEKPTIVQEENVKYEQNDGDVEVEVHEKEDVICLIQEDSEDCKNLPLGVVGNEEKIMESAIKKRDKIDEETTSECFGNYLKSNKINVSDLGLIPLNDDDDDVEETRDKVVITIDNADTEDMPSLIILDDDDEDAEKAEAGNKHDLQKCKEGKAKLNETFEAIKEIKQEIKEKQIASFEVTDEAVDNSLQSFLQNEAAAIAVEDEAMDALKMSEDDETPRKAPRIVLNTTDGKNTTLLTTPKSLSNPSTPNQKAKPFRFPTPYRNRNIVNRTPTSSAKKLPAHHNNKMNFAFSTLEPREIVLRGIRKRSLSMCLGGGEINKSTAAGGSAVKRQRPLRGPLATHRQQKTVNFYSPANCTTIIDDIDKVIENNVRKDKKGRIIQQTTNVTTRRKRSVSLDESIMSKPLSKIPRIVEATISASTSTSSLNSSKLMTRTKLPNFAAIHQKHFQKMENLVDHVTRKQERSKVLINSASKIKSASAQKNITLNKTEKLNQLDKPKALKKINLEGTSKIKTKPLQNTLATKSTAKTIISTPTKLTTKTIISTPTKSSKENQSMVEKSNLPHPRDLPQSQFLKFVNKYQQHLKPTQATNVLANTKPSLKANKKLPQQQQKPFNLSTHIPTKAQVVKPKTASSVSSASKSSSFCIKPTSSTSTTTAISSSSKANASLLSSQDKMTSRLQRHMDLFKGRVPSTRSDITSRKLDANIRGVRSNRRFELQMQHRKNLEH